MVNLTLEKVNKIYDNGFHAVYDFDLEIEDGEFIVFVGPSGCGKSTMLRTIAGLEEVSKGKIILDGKLVNKVSPKKRGIAMVFQSYALYPHLNIYDNLSFGLVLEGFDEDYIEERVKETAKILGIDMLLDRHPRQLSGGQCQRVAVGRAIIRKPKVFLMDEPLSNLDAKQRASMRSEIIEIHRKTKATTIYVTHDQIEAMTMADRIVVMKDGYIQQVGTPHQLYFTPKNKFVAGFIGEPPMNFLKATVSGNNIVVGDTKFSLGKIYDDILKSYSGQELVLGFRPESVVVGGKGKDMVEFTSTVEVSELLGDSVNVYANIEGSRAILKVSPKQMPNSGDSFSFGVPHSSVYLFDANTEDALYAEGDTKGEVTA